MNANGVCVGVEADEQQVNGSPATEAVLNRFPEVMKPLQSRSSREGIVAAVGSTPLMGGIEGTEVVGDHLEITGRSVGVIGNLLTEAAVLRLHPAIDCGLDVEHRTSVGATTHCAEGNAQGVGDRVRQPAISAGRHVQKMEAAFKEKGIEVLGGLTA